MNQYTVKLQNFEKQNHINSSILNRQITENNLQPNIDFRPIPTKYTHFNVFGNLQEKTCIFDKESFSMENRIILQFAKI